MNDVKKVKNTKEKSEKKYFLIFLGILAVCFLGGLLMGVISRYLTLQCILYAGGKILIGSLQR